MTSSLRVTDATRQRAAALAAEGGSSIGEVIERALDQYERARFWERTRAALARHPGAERDDHDTYDAAARDGLDRD